MASFTDCEGRVWTLRITMADVPKLRAAGLDLGASAKDKEGFGLDPLGAALDDLDTLGRVLWTLCEVRATALGLTPEAFAAGFDGPALMAAQEALAAAYVSFTQPRHAAKLTQALAGVMDKATRTAGTVLDQILSGLNEPAGNSPGSPGSPPAPTP